MDKFIFYEKVIPALDSVIPRFKWNLPGAEQGFNGNAIGGIIILILPLISVTLKILAVSPAPIYLLTKP